MSKDQEMYLDGLKTSADMHEHLATRAKTPAEVIEGLHKSLEIHRQLVGYLWNEYVNANRGRIKKPWWRFWR